LEIKPGSSPPSVECGANLICEAGGAGGNAVDGFSLRWPRLLGQRRQQSRLSVDQRHVIPATHLANFLLHVYFMYSRLSSIARHLSRPSPYIKATLVTPVVRATVGNATMASSVLADERNSRTIHTAACLIIGDEVLGGKVCYMDGSLLSSSRSPANTGACTDGRCTYEVSDILFLLYGLRRCPTDKLGIHGQVVLLTRHRESISSRCPLRIILHADLSCMVLTL
jgi:hypothetical protein